MGILRWGIVAEMEADDGAPPRQFSEVDLSPHAPHDSRNIHVGERDLRLDVALRPFPQRVHRRFELDRFLGAEIVDGARRLVLDTLDQAQRFHLLEPPRQERGRDVAHPLANVVEAGRAVPELVQDLDRPARFQDLAGARDRAEQSVRPPRHG